MADLEIDISWSPERLETEMNRTSIMPAKSSTYEYYNNNKDTSYPINLDSDIRGRAIVFVMTRRRPGWQHEVWDLYKMFKSLKIEAQFIYDPNLRTLTESLLEFVTDGSNDLTDCCFVTFLGHGSRKEGNNQDVFVVIDDDEVNVWGFCQFIFAKPRSRLKHKPKVFFIQSCRQTKPVNIGFEDCSGSNVIRLRRDKTLNHYQFLFSCQPGELCDRGLLVKYVSENISQYAYHLHMDDILGKKILQCFITTPNQMPQLLGCMPHYLNMFPGVTKHFLQTSERLSYPVQEFKPTKSQLYADRQSVSMEVEHYSLDPLHESGSGRLVPAGMENVPMETDTSTKYLINSINSSGSGGSTSKTQHSSKTKDKREIEKTNDNNNFGISSKRVKLGERERKECKLVLNIKETIPNTEENIKDAEKKIYQNLEKPEKQEEIAKHLTDDLEAVVKVVGISEGSVILHITLDDEAAFEKLVFLSDTGVLSSLLQMHLVTPAFEDGCTADKVKINVILDTTAMKNLPTVFEEIPSKFPVCSNGVTITCPSSSDEAIHEAKWYKDDKRLKSKDRVKLKHSKDSSQMQILNTVMADTGRYRCEYKDPDERQHITECSIIVVKKLIPPRNVFVEDICCQSVTINVSTAWQNPKCNYRVKVWMQSNLEETFSKFCNQPRLRVDGLIPGETYKLTVVCVPDSDTDPLYIESDPTPLDGYTFNTKPNPPVVTTIQKISPHEVKLKWNKPKNSMKCSIDVRYDHTGSWHLHKPAVNLSNASCTALVKNIFPLVEYEFGLSFWFGDIKSESLDIREFLALCCIRIGEKRETTVTLNWEWTRANWTDGMLVAGYDIECIPQSGDKQNELTQHFKISKQFQTSVKINMLEPDTEYVVRFVPVDCMSRPLAISSKNEHVKEINVRTAKSFEPRGIEVTQNRSHGVPAVHIKWKPGAGENTGYKLRYWYDERCKPVALFTCQEFRSAERFYTHLRSSDTAVEEATVLSPSVPLFPRKSIHIIEHVHTQDPCVTLYHLIPGRFYGVSVSAVDGNEESDECYYTSEGKYEEILIKQS